jgi:hypothetical protein
MFTGPNIITDGLVLYLDAANQKSYPGTSTAWTDLSGNGNNGTLVNGPTFNSGNNGSIVFDGVNDHVEINDFSGNLNIRGSVTVSMLCKSNWTSETGWNTSWTGVSKYNQFILGPNGTNGKMAFLVHSGTWYPLGYGNQIWGQTDINPKDYHLYTGVYNQESGFVYFYVDGDLEVSFNIGIRVLTDDPNSFTIAKRDVSNNYLNSSISHISIYNRALTTQEILQNYNATKSRFGL